MEEVSTFVTRWRLTEYVDSVLTLWTFIREAFSSNLWRHICYPGDHGGRAFAPSISGVLGLNSTRGMDVFVRLFCVYVEALRRADPQSRCHTDSVQNYETEMRPRSSEGSVGPLTNELIFDALADILRSFVTRLRHILWYTSIRPRPFPSNSIPAPHSPVISPFEILE
jgi:hypothetical protein